MAVHETLQSVFDTIWHEFVVLGRKQAYSDGACVYRGNNKDAASPIRCALGVCIPDDLYDPRIEAYRANRLATEMPGWYVSVFNGIQSDALAELQSYHDDEFENMKECLESFADEHALVVPSAAP